MGHVTWKRIAVSSILLASLTLLFSPAGRTAHNEPNRETALGIMASQSIPPLVAEYHGFIETSAKSAEDLHSGNSGGIREEVPEKYSARYQRWKQEFLTTETGRQQWASYQSNPNFTLTVVMTQDNPEGGNTGSYAWNEKGELVAATITLGCRLDEGVPDPIYFPVMNSLKRTKTTRNIGGKTLAATKIAHEFGHVIRTAKGDPMLYQLQVQLMPEYNQILMSNGRDTRDPRLLELARRMGATPVEIWEDREYWGETNAMIYLRDRFADDDFRCLLFGKIKRSLDLYARGYQERFISIAQSTPSAHRCGW